MFFSCFAIFFNVIRFIYLYQCVINYKLLLFFILFLLYIKYLIIVTAITLNINIRIHQFLIILILLLIYYLSKYLKHNISMHLIKNVFVKKKITILHI